MTQTTDDVQPLLVNMKQAAAMLCCSPRTLHKRVQDGSIAVVRGLSNRIYFHVEEIERFARESQQRKKGCYWHKVEA